MKPHLFNQLGLVPRTFFVLSSDITGADDVTRDYGWSVSG